MDTATLLLSCKDKKGIVAEVSHFISTYEGNILHSDQHHDAETNTFFMRIEFDLNGFALPSEKIAQAFEPIALKFSMDWRLEFSGKKIRTALFVSKFEHCLYDLLLRSTEGEIRPELAMIVSNHEKCRPIAEYFNIPFYYFPVDSSNKDEVEAAQIRLLKEQNIELVVLARYMQILTNRFVDEFRYKIINIHHSFLPAFIGAKPYHQAYSRGVKIIGATSHYVTADLDQGPIIEQDVARITHRDSVADLIRKGRNLEKNVLAQAVKAHLEHRVLVFGNKTVVFD